jgi:purine-binding chemotaxis protein CheW
MTPETPPQKPKRARTSKTVVQDMAAAISASNDVLRERARQLAQPPAEETSAAVIEVVMLLLAYETYAIETAYVREVYPLKDLTLLPCTPAFVAGIVNVRGQVMSVIDLKQLFELPVKGLTDLNKIVILSDGLMEFGILADAILGVQNIPLHEIEPVLPTLTGVREDYLKGITAEGVVVLDAAKLLHSNNIVIHEEVA